MGLKFRTDRLEVEGEPFTVAAQVAGIAGGMFVASVSGTGALAYTSSTPSIGRLIWFNRSGNRLDSVGREGVYLDLRLSPDEKRLAATVVDPRTGLYDVWVTDLARGAPTRFALSGLNQNPIWSPDGTRIVYRSLRASNAEFCLKSAAGGGSEETIFSDSVQLAVRAINPVATDWSPDGRYLIYSTLTPALGYDLWLLPVTGSARQLRI